MLKQLLSSVQIFSQNFDGKCKIFPQPYHILNIVASSRKTLLTTFHAMATTVNKRVHRDYNQLAKEPIPGIRAHPDKDNILLCHFILHGDGMYKGGEYCGQLILHPEFPYKPPHMKMMTPSGRFKVDENICMNMTGFHPTQWNPLWTIRTLLLGFQSFFYDDNDINHIGSTQKVSEKNRRMCAEQSVTYNNNNRYIANVLENYFPDLLRTKRKCSSSPTPTQDADHTQDDADHDHHNKRQKRDEANEKDLSQKHDDTHGEKHVKDDTHAKKHEKAIERSTPVEKTSDKNKIDIIEILD